jgi:hypothetical protein
MTAIVHADPRVRRRALILVVTTVLVGVVGLSFFNDFLRDMEALATASPQMADQQLKPIRIALVAGALCVSITLAGLLTYIALRVIRAGQYPPPGMHVLWETPIRTGRQATVAATLMLVVAVAALVYGVVAVRLVWPGPEVQIGSPMREV